MNWSRDTDLRLAKYNTNNSHLRKGVERVDPRTPIITPNNNGFLRGVDNLLLSGFSYYLTVYLNSYNANFTYHEMPSSRTLEISKNNYSAAGGIE